MESLFFSNVKCNWAIYRTRNTRLFIRIPGNVITLEFQGIFKKILKNIAQNSREFPKRFREIFEKIPGNVEKIRGFFKEILGNVQEDSGVSRIFQRIFEKIPRNGFKFELIKDRFY